MTIRIQPPPRRLPGKVVNDYDKHLASRLTKLAAAGSSGVAPVSSPVAGAIYFQDGRVVFAECGRTPHPTQLSSSLGAMLAGGEATVDAALELLSNRSTSGRFRPMAQPARDASFDSNLRFDGNFSLDSHVSLDGNSSFEVEGLLAEVARRRRLLRQMAGFTADSPLARNPSLPAERMQVSAGQWALIIRVYPGSTSRGLAWALGRSVFSTTSEIYRLIVLGLVTAEVVPDGGAEPVSFTRALTSEKGKTAVTATRRRAGL